MRSWRRAVCGGRLSHQVQARPVPRNVLHAPVPSHTPAAPGAPDAEESYLRTTPPPPVESTPPKG